MSTIKFSEYEGPIGDDMLLSLARAAHHIFDDSSPTELSVRQRAKAFARELNGFSSVYLCCAHDGQELIGYKVGRSNDPRTFESWNGGVMPSSREQGVGTELARRQEDWCREQGFLYLETETAYNNTPMLILNLRRGFHVAGTYWDREKNLKVILQKALQPVDTGPDGENTDGASG